MAEEHAPSIVFIDEIDAIGTKRYGTLLHVSGLSIISIDPLLYSIYLFVVITMYSL